MSQAVAAEPPVAAPAAGLVSPAPWIVLVVVATVVLGAGFGVAASAQPNQGFKDATAALAIIGAASVGIERILELWWTAVGVVANDWWPFNALAKGINKVVDGVDTTVEPFFKEVERFISDTSTAAKWSEDQIEQAEDEVKHARDLLAQFKQMAPDDVRAQLLVSSATQAINYLQSKYSDPRLQATGTAALAAIKEIQDLAGSFKDHPGRRLISIYLGALLGLAAAYFLGLDLFLASTGQIQKPAPGLHWGVALTGVVMGLGSSPTHELIKVIQEFKQNISN
jgi:hypothetical protein